MELQLDFQLGLLFTEMELETLFPFSWRPQLQIFLLCPSLPIFLSLLFLHGINKWAQGSKLLLPLPSPLKL